VFGVTKTAIDNDAEVLFTITEITTMRISHPTKKRLTKGDILIQPFLFQVTYVGLVNGIRATLVHNYGYDKVFDNTGSIEYPDQDCTLFVSCDVGFVKNEFILEHRIGDSLELLCTCLKDVTRTGTIGYRLGYVRTLSKVVAQKAA